MKFISFIVIILLLNIDGIGQTKWNIFAGPQSTSSKYSIGGKKQDNDMKFGFQAGIGLKVPFDTKLFFAPAAFYSLKGYKVNFSLPSFPPDGSAKNNNTTINTFELAALLQYDFSTNPAHFFLKGGPSLDFQLSGKEKFDLANSGLVSRKMVYGFGDYGHYSANMLAQFGFETKSGFLLFVQYTLGITSLDNFDGGPDIRHRAIGLSLGKTIF
jgi:hypothetical protein